MADRTNVGGIEADVVLQTGSIASDLGKLKAALDKAAAAIKSLQSATPGASSSLAELAQKVDALASGNGVLSAAIKSLEASQKAQTATTKAAAAATAGAATAYNSVTTAALAATNATASSVSASANMAAAMNTVRSAGASLTPNLINAASAMSNVATAAAAMAPQIINAANAMNTATSSAAAMAPQIINAAQAKQQMASASASLTPQIINMAAATNRSTAGVAALTPKIINFEPKAKKGADAASHFARGIMQVGYVADDLQYSLAACVNNVAPLIQSFAMAGGVSATNANLLAGALQLVAVAASQVYLHWDQLEKYFGLDSVKTQAEAMEALAKSTHRTAEETAKLNKYKKEQLEIASMMEGKTTSEKAQDKAVSEALDEAGPTKVLKGIAEVKLGSGRGAKLTPEEVEKIEHKAAQATKFGRHIDEKSSALMRTINEPRRAAYNAKRKEMIEEEEGNQTAERAKELMNKAKSDPNALRELMGVVKSNPKAFPENFARDLKEGLPESIKENASIKADEEGQKQRQEMADDNKRLDDKAEKEAKQKEKEQREAKKRDRNDRKEVASKLNPEIKEIVAQAALAVDRGGDPIDAKNLIKSVLQTGNGAAGFSEEDAGETAGDLFNDATKGSPEERAKKEKQRRKERARENKEMAEELVPGIGKLAENGAAGAILGGMPMADVGKALSEELVRAGMDPKRAQEAGAEAADNATQKIVGKANDKATEGKDDKHQPSQSEIYATSSLTQKIQSSISDMPESKKQTDLLDKSVQYLADIAASNGKTLKIRVN